MHIYIYTIYLPCSPLKVLQHTKYSLIINKTRNNKKMITNSHALLWLLSCQLLLLLAKVGAKVPAIIVFGDSSVDAGNNNFIPTVARSNFQPYGRDFTGGKPTGRFSNGRIATDFISEAIGLKQTIPPYLDPAYSISDFATGVTFASAATGYDNATSDVLVSTHQLKSFFLFCLYSNKRDYEID